MKFSLNALFLIILLSIALFQSSCWELLETEGIGGLSETTILPEDATVLNEADLRINGEGRLVASNELSLNNLLGEIEIKRINGRNPELFIKGRTNPFGEVIPEENKIKVFEYNKEFGLSKTIYAVEYNNVVVRANEAITSNNVVGMVNKGNLVVTLSEENGWYQVKVVQNGKITYGWIEGKYLTPVVTGTITGSNCERDFTGNLYISEKLTTQFRGKLTT
jgi:hypothetical protein